ncbi:hypothetical protein PR202_gb15589 [Eleusine coracana subsp. coracana]|uniref:F-box domain-containing protein n=1 Tax=Eleusine coracana subsp. coracana TaxID=191504 RepID=A0AAV5EYA6_ELECO|nr:hypothetical protein QOZ80_4BG0347930 [Eleusine coracana subsp. coracana]GJN27559.1 hypothetical protein PR202_gb15589 [Eleusine coracana subsp. coracana]
METPHMDSGARAVDRLSELPDCIQDVDAGPQSILDDILSRVTSRQACRTSVLSRRWRHVWRAVPSRCIDIDQLESSAYHEVNKPAEEDHHLGFKSYQDASTDRLHRQMKQQHEFERFADRLTTQHDPSSPPLDTFQLRVSCVDLRRIARPQVDLARTRAPPRRVPPLLRQGRPSRSLYALGSMLPRPHRVPSPRPLDRCGCYCTDEKLVLALPRLTSLRINVSGCPPVVTAEAEMPSLVSASLLACSSDGDLDTLCSLRDARSLDLSGFLATSLLVVGESKQGVPMFRNLKTLLSECELGVECQVLRRFLRDRRTLP